MPRALLASAILTLGGVLSSCAMAESYSGEIVGDQRVVEVRAKRFEFSPSVITVREGETVVLKIISEDVMHGFFLDGYETQTTIPPGEIRVLGFMADRAGRFTFRCSMTCGEFHPYMVGNLRVLPNRTYLAGLSLVGLLGLGSLALNGRKKGPRSDRLFGLIPLGARFELTQYRPVRALFKSRWFPLVPVLGTAAVFLVILVSAWRGGSSAGNLNFGVMSVWVLWWVLLMTVFVPVVGRAWCMVCPFPLPGDWLQRGKLVGVGRQKSWGLNRKWPRQFRNLWPVTATFTASTLFLGFFTVTPFATFVLLSVMLLAAVVISLVFEKRTFCLYACPVSGFQGLYANFSACEVRVKDPEICKAHTPKTCYVGNERGYGCPWMELPFDLNRNTYCGMCLECFKTCPHDNMAFNLRPFGADLLAERRRTDDINHRRGLDEAFKSLTMIGVLFAFFVTMQGPHGWIKDMARAASLSQYGLFVGAYVALNFLLVPLSFLAVSWVSKVASGNREVSLTSVFVEFSYCLVPLGLARWASFSLGVLLPNGSYLPRVLSDPLGAGWSLFGTASYAWTPYLTGALPYLQTGFLLGGLAFSLEFGRRFAGRIFATEAEARRGWVPMLVFLVGLSMFFLWLFEG
ncbi:MAG: cupredoxin domain-containing protein [Longimicrobiales bacterium]|nr:cupredoxin domain-containing protein [Longimicrobiales bacterium]